MIRAARIEDYPQWLELAKRLLDKTPYVGIPPEYPGVAKLYSQCIQSRLGCVFVAEHDCLTGTILGVTQELWWSRKKYTTDLLFYSEHPGDGPLLIQKFLNWAWAIPSVMEVTMGQSSGLDIDRTGLLYERAGLTRVGAIYSKVRVKT